VLTPPSATGTTGFSLSPGGLLLPYHVGALASLEYNGHLDPIRSPLAGSSAGAIAVAAYGCGVSPEKTLEATIQVSDRCAERGGARGNLLPFVRQCMEEIIDENDFHENFIQRRQQQQNQPKGGEQKLSSMIGICYRELFPRNRPILKTTFEDRQELIQSVSNSCMFPFFSTNWPCTVDWSSSSFIPRLVVDGYFAVPRERFGCPDFDLMLEDTELIEDDDKKSLQLLPNRTVAISVFPADKIGLTAFDKNDVISPSSSEDIERLFRIATKSTSREELTFAYELGWKNAEEQFIPM